MSFDIEAKHQQSKFRTTLSPEARQPTDGEGQSIGHVIPPGYEQENLYPSIRGTDGALAFFGERKIKWWASTRRSGDRLINGGYSGPTGNMASSQIACVNYLLPLADNSDVLTQILGAIDTDIEGVIPICHQGTKSLVEFEWVGWKEPLEPVRITRGAHQTSVDAVLVAQTRSGKRAYLLEWKHTEKYLNPEYKGSGREGKTRTGRYLHLFRASDSPFIADADFDSFLEEPFYQIMRQLLLAQKIIRECFTQSIRVDEAKVVVVCPFGNTDYRQVAPGTRMAAAFPNFDSVIEVVRANLKDPARFAMVAPEEILSTLSRTDVSGSIEEWGGYHRLRYGW
jgi:hypothetical protein